MVPERWPLTCVDHLDRVLAGCCWKVQATRTTPSESYEVAKCLTMKLAVYLAKEVAAILRAVLTHETKKLYNDSTVHLLCSNYWVQPIYQELLHSSSRRNATRECERKRPSSGLARVTAYAKPPKQRRPSASGTSFSDWIGGTCHADTLQVWFPAHWAPVVLQQLQKKEDRYRAENPSWMDKEVALADIPKQWQKARANRRMQFKVGNYRDGSWESNIRLLTGTIKVDWILTYVETRCHRWGLQAERRCPLGDYQRGEVATLSLSSQWTLFGGLVCRGLWLTNCLAGGLYDGGWSSTQGCWLWLSWPKEEVWCQNHVGRSWPTMATLAEPVSGEGTWLVFTCWPQRKALHKQVQTAGRWLERGLAYWRRHYSLASLECCTWPYLAVMQTWPTIGVSWWKGAYPCYVWPNWQRRTGHIPSIYSHSTWCIYEGTEEKEAGWGQCPGRVDYAAWLHAARSGA